MLQTIYATGLRVSEACALKVSDIDSAPERMCVRVASGKGGKGRYSILSPTLLQLLRHYARTYQPQTWSQIPRCNFQGRRGQFKNQSLRGNSGEETVPKALARTSAARLHRRILDFGETLAISLRAPFVWHAAINPQSQPQPRL